MRSATVVLPVPGLPVKLMCSDGAPAASRMSRAHLVDDEQRGDLADALLDRREADQLGIELVEHGLHAGLVRRSLAGRCVDSLMRSGLRSASVRDCSRARCRRAVSCSARLRACRAA